MNPTTRRRLINLAAGLLLAQAAVASIERFVAERHRLLSFDDAYMFLRYAHNLRHGLGFSWNLDGIHTYGPTSLLWSFCVLLLSYLPTDPWTQLILGSWLCSIAAILVVAWAVAANSQSPWLRSLLRVLPLIVLPLSGSVVFEANQFNGMETMLATALCGLFLGIALLWRAGRAPSAALSFAAFLLFLARPESALIALLLPLFLWLLLEAKRPPLKPLLVYYGLLLVGVAVQLVVCKEYFGTPVPLSVYMKGGRAYLGYPGNWHPELLLIAFLGATQIFLGALILLARRRDVRLLVACLLPPAAVFAYLSTVTQIMGFNSRYYVPYAPLIVVPTLLVLDRWLACTSTETEASLWPGHTLRLRATLTAALFLFFLVLSSEGVQERIRVLEHHSRDQYDSALLPIDAAAPLPKASWQSMMFNITDDLIAPLPPGATVAATEVGYLGDRATHLNIIDLAGLNDTDIALHGFHPDAFLERKPDLIWMPNSDYSYQRGVLFSDPGLLAQYDLYADAGNYGIAIRKDSRFRPELEHQLHVFWAKTYPGTAPSCYLVHSVTWSGQKHVVTGE